MFRSRKKQEADGSSERPQVWRQGDVFIVSTPNLPDDVSGHRPILAEGEVTGHSHRVSDPVTAQVFRGNTGMFMQVTADQATIVHDEHAPVMIPRGNYAIRIQREYHPKEIRRVVD